MRAALAKDDPSFRKAYLRLFVDQVIVTDDEIRLRGPKAAPAKALTEPAIAAGDTVPSFVPKWRPVRDSNSCYRRERAVS